MIHLSMLFSFLRRKEWFFFEHKYQESEWYCRKPCTDIEEELKADLIKEEFHEYTAHYLCDTSKREGYSIYYCRVLSECLCTQSRHKCKVTSFTEHNEAHPNEVQGFYFNCKSQSCSKNDLEYEKKQIWFLKSASIVNEIWPDKS